MAAAVFDKLALIGAGLIGSSIARAAAETGAAAEISVWDRDPVVREAADELGLGQVTPDLQGAVTGADCVILCVPVGAIGAVTQAVADDLAPGAILTDVGSVKTVAASAMAEHAPGAIHVIPGHPIAGTEASGPAAGFASLFKGAWHILTPLASETEKPGHRDAVKTLTAFWERLGARVETMAAERHDRVLAITSHLPHLIAFNIVSTAYDMERIDEQEVVKYSAGGFRDFTRIAASDPTMWRDVFLTNKAAVLETLGRFSEDLAALQRAIRWDDGDMLYEAFSRARGIRQAIIDAGMDRSEVNFGRDQRPDADLNSPIDPNRDA
ncbi:MAG: prephenate/arogenate dehydrogenase family protein [Pseudomonadota bacterium]